MLSCRGRAGAYAVALAALSVGAAAAQGPPQAALPAAVLRGLPRGVELRAGVLQRLAAGEVVVAGVDGSAGHEAGGYAIARVPAAAVDLLGEGLESTWLVEAAAAEAFAWLPDQPTAEQIGRVDLIEQDYADLGGCRPGSCKVKLPVGLILALRARVDWDEPGARSLAADLVFGELARRAAAYQRSGDAALGSADDKRRRVSLREEVRGLVAGADSFARAFPELHAYLLRYPAAPPPGVRSRLFAMRTTMGAGKEVVSVQHALEQRRDDPVVPFVWVTKQLYASHYLEATLGLTYLVADGRQGAYLVHEFRSRLDILRGWGLFHGRVRRGVRELLATRLETVRQRIREALAAR